MMALSRTSQSSRSKKRLDAQILPVSGQNTVDDYHGEFSDESKDQKKPAKLNVLLKHHKRSPPGRHCQWTSKLVLSSVSDNLDPFSSLPSDLTRSDEHLISFYLQAYPQMTYGLSSKLKPHPVNTNFSIALNTPACFQVILARAALYRLNAGSPSSINDRKQLEESHVSHKGNAIRIIRETVDSSTGTTPKSDSVKKTEDLIASIISLGTLDKRTGNDLTAATHFQAVRTIIRHKGGPVYIQNMALSRVMCHFESIYGSPSLSYVWDREHHLKPLLEDTNRFFGQLFTFCQSRRDTKRCLAQSKSDEVRSVADAQLELASDLFQSVCRPLPDIAKDAVLSAKEKMALSFQLACLLTLSLIIHDLSISTFAISKSFPVDESKALMEHFLETSSSLHDLKARLNDPDLIGMPLNNHCWLLQTYDMSTAHSLRSWRAGAHVWVLKHTHHSVQRSAIQWLLDFANLLTTDVPLSSKQSVSNDLVKNGKSRPMAGRNDTNSSSGSSVEGLKPFKLQPFHFSYAM